MKKIIRKKSGFTLMELLVVVAIIGLISSVAFVSMQRARAEARDTKRLADIDAVHNALELYYNDYGVYPNSSICNNLSAVSACNSNFMPNTWIADLVPKYMKTLPIDPLNRIDNETGNHYFYIYTRWESDLEEASQKYFLVYRLETKDKIVGCDGIEYGGTWSGICGGDLD